MNLNRSEVRVHVTVDYTNIAGTTSHVEGPVTLLSATDFGVGGITVRMSRINRVNGKLVAA